MNLLNQLYQIQATLFQLFLKTWGFHWNVIGGDFYQVHALLGEQYTFMFDEIDTIAEHIRTFEAKALGSLEIITQKSIIEDATMTENPTDMLDKLKDDQLQFVQLVKQTHRLADEEGRPATTALLEQVLLDHDKMIWKLRSMLK